MVAHQYNLPCTCGKRHVVDTGLAGSTLTCSCGRTLEVPTLRGLQQLEPHVEAAAKPVVHASKPVGCLFVSCLAVALIAAAVAGAAVVIRNQIDTSYTLEMDIAEGEKLMDVMPIDQTYEVWKAFNQQGLGPPSPPQFVRNIILARQLRAVIVVAATIACLGGLATLAVFVVDSRRKK